MIRNFLTAMLLACANSVAAQETTGDIRGAIKLPDGTAAASVRVTVTSESLSAVRHATTGPDGVFQVLRLAPGAYRVSVSAIGYRPITTDNVVVQLGRTAGVGDMRLVRTTVQLDPIRIIEKPLTVDPTRTTVGAVLDASDYSALPAERDYKSLVSVLPHINTSFHGDPVNAAGSTGLENMFYIDGANVTSPLNGASATNLPYNFVRSVEVRTGGYEAQYGNALGAIVNAVTYTGTNRFESNIFGYFTHDAFAAEPRSQPVVKETAFYSYDLGVRIGGPIIRDRLFYSAAWNPRVDHSDKLIAGLGVHPQSTIAQVYAAKLTWQPRQESNVEVSLFGDPAKSDNVSIFDYVAGLRPLNADPYLQKLETGGTTAAIRASTITKNGILLEAAVTRSSFRDNVLSRSPRGLESLVADFVEGTVAGGLGSVQQDEQRRTAALVRATASPGAHTVTIGAEYEDAYARHQFHNPGLGFIERLDSTIFYAYEQGVFGHVRNRSPAAYLQDSWRITDRLTLNPGIRWSNQYLSGTSDKTAQRFLNEWQPRIGFNWLIGEGARQRFFGSYGRYYQREPLNLATLYYIDYNAIIRTYTGNPTAGGVLTSSFDASTPASLYTKSIKDASVENLDELAAGYERLVGSKGRLTMRILHRSLRSTFQQGVDSSGAFMVGSAGRGSLSFLPTPERRYTGLETSIEGDWRSFQYRGSYVLSRNYGNFTGLYPSDVFIVNPGNNPTFATVHARKNTSGLLPNDRTHVVKASGAYRITQSLSAGAHMSWMSGTPLSEMGLRDFFLVFLSQRGSVGRTPGIWDINLRLSHDRKIGSTRARIVGDILHAGNPRRAVRQDMQHYRTSDDQGNPVSLNENYLRATVFQPPMTARIGVEITPR